MSKPTKSGVTGLYLAATRENGLLSHRDLIRDPLVSTLLSAHVLDAMGPAGILTPAYRLLMEMATDIFSARVASMPVI